MCFIVAENGEIHHEHDAIKVEMDVYAFIFIDEIIKLQGDLVGMGQNPTYRGLVKMRDAYKNG